MSQKRKNSAHAEAYHHIKSAILENKAILIEPLVEQQLASSLGLSRTPVREALRLLESDGLVTYQKGKGWKIARLTPRDLNEIFELKILLEPAAAGLAAKIASPEVRARLLEISQQMTQCAQENDVEKWLELDAIFHQLLLESIQNKRLMDIVNSLNDQWWRVQVGIAALKARMLDSGEEHLEIAQAVCEGNVERASSAMRSHLMLVQETLQEELKTAFRFSVQGL